MRISGILLLFGGYVLVYAAVANKGKFATDPWTGLMADAYPTPIFSQQAGQTLTNVAGAMFSGSGNP